MMMICIHSVSDEIKDKTFSHDYDVKSVFCFVSPGHHQIFTEFSDGVAATSLKCSDLFVCKAKVVVWQVCLFVVDM